MRRTAWALAALLIAAAGCGDGAGGTPAMPPTAVPTTPEPPPEPPGKPTGIRVVDAGPDFLVWVWNPVEGATSYEAHAFPYGTPPSERPPLQVTVEPTFRADGLEPGTVMGIFVRAIRETAGERAVGLWSDQGTGRTLTLQPPNAPANLRVSAVGEDFVEWSWNAVPVASGYEVQFSPDAEFTEADEVIDVSGQTVYRREGLSTETSAYLRVRSYRGTGDDRLRSGWTPVLPATTLVPAVLLTIPDAAACARR